jgi:hypothetical protein
MRYSTIAWWVAAAMVWGVLIVSNTYAHDDAILNCAYNLVVEKVVKLGEDMMVNGLLIEYYDRNGDGISDIKVLSSILGAMEEETGLIPHRANPTFWTVDMDLDGKDDRVFIDIHGEGVCKDIKLYVDLHKPLPEDFFRGRGPMDYQRETEL